jgi:pilus assembly protein CpaB
MLFAALLLGGAATWLTASWLDRAAQANALTRGKETPTVRILVAAMELKPGDTLGPGMLHWQIWPQTAVRPEHFVEGGVNPQALAGAMIRKPVAKGEPLLPAHMVKRGEQGILAALIAPGHRAISIAVTASSGLAGFVEPGDRVDVLLTAGLQQGGSSRIVGKTVADTVRVLGVDQRVEPAAVAESAPPATVTLEVTAGQARAIAVAQELGKLSLALRDLKAGQERAPAEASAAKTWDTDVTRLPASLFSSAASGLSMAASPAMGLPAAIAATPAQAPDVATVSATGAVERANGVEIVRGSSNRGAAPAGAPAAAP